MTSDQDLAPHTKLSGFAQFLGATGRRLRTRGKVISHLFRKGSSD
ncbi:hypothetical protein [Ensifer aridi]|nr:hypothetical protein [Ensifer aridi]